MTRKPGKKRGEKKHGGFLPSLRHRAEDAAASLPALIVEAERAAHTIRSGGHAQHKPGMGENFWQFRDYDSADRPQDIDWRQSARGDRVFVRQKERQNAQTTLFWCADDAGMSYASEKDHPTKREAALIISLGLAILMTQAGDQVGLLDGGMSAGRSGNAVDRMAQGLITHKSGDLPLAVRNIMPHTGMVLAGDFLETPERIEAAFHDLAPFLSHATVIQVLDPAEITLPFEGRIVFESHNGAERHHIASAASIRADYCARIERHLEDVRTICRRAGWRYILHRTDQKPEDTLAALWRMMMPEKAS